MPDLGPMTTTSQATGRETHPPTGASSDPAELQQWIESAEAKAAAKDRAGAIQDLERALALKPESPFLLKTLGGLLLESEFYWEARQRFQQLLRQQPDQAEVHVLAGISSLKMGRLDEFETDLARALQLDPKNAEALRWRARVAFDNQQHAEAGQYYSRLVQNGHGDADTLAALGFCLARGQEWEMAAETFAQALVTQGGPEVARENLEVIRKKLGRAPLPCDPARLVQEADIDLQSGLNALACWAWMEVLKGRPRDNALRQSLVSILLEQRWNTAAQPHLEELARSNPWDPGIGTWLALVRFESGNREGAREALEAVFSLDPTFREARRLEADFALRDGRYDEAWWLTQRLCQRDPQDTTSVLSRGICAFHLGRWDEAARDLESVLQRHPENELVRKNLEVVHDRQKAAAAAKLDAHVRSELDEAGRLQAAGDWKSAIQKLEPVTQLRPDWAEAWDALGSLRYLSGDAEGGRNDLTKAVRLAPGLPEPQIRLAMACNACGRDSEALAILDQVTHDHPGQVSALRLRGDLLLENDPKVSMECYSACLRGSSGVTEDLIRLGLACLRNEQNNQAQALLQAVLTIQPDHAVALKALERVRGATHG